MSTALKVENLSKKYMLGTIGYGTLGRDMQAWWARIRGKEDPNTKIGEKSRLDIRGDFWALRDINFEIKAGDRVGVIGRNGAGKSTLLKLLSRVTSPTIGEIKISGRISSLLEVGTGFHPELTGRENIFLNGAILGMKRGEIQRKFDEIVSFAGVEQFVDTPVKRYSSGMYVRLAFSVSAHLDSDIMIVDEVLAVGDAEFQKKCVSKMEEVSLDQGRTVMFVSHNPGLISQLCNQGILLEEGRIKATGEIANVLSQYYGNSEIHGTVDFVELKRKTGPNLKLLNVELKNGRNVICDEFQTGESVKIVVKYQSNIQGRLRLGIELKNDQGNRLTDFRNDAAGVSLEANSLGAFSCEFNTAVLNLGKYVISIYCELDDIFQDYIGDAIAFNIISSPNSNSLIPLSPSYPIVLPQIWKGESL